MIFDQYSRYKACSDLIRQAGFIAGDSVLDIGSGPERLFGKFMLDATMSYVDPLIPIGSGQRHITGNIFSKELDGQVFDHVSAIDVLEHVPSEHRRAFVERMSLLCKDTLILGFPTSDSSNALETDKAIDDQYRKIFNHDYSWLEEHYRYGLPSLAETVEQLSQLGWNCQTIGHGHTPWLKDLLSFVICVWDIPSLSNVVLEISEKFNRELYPYDFRPPYYRQFVIASRGSTPLIMIPEGDTNNIDMEASFRALMEEAHRKYFSASIRQLADAAAVIAKHDAKIVECNAKINEISSLEIALNATLAERNEAIALVDLIRSSNSWRITRPFRFLVRLARYGVTSEDRQQLSQRLRRWYHRLPLPAPAKRLASFTYHKVVGKGVKALLRSAKQAAKFRAPTIMLAAKLEGQPDYIVWGVIDWHFRHQRPQHLAQALAASGRRIFYVGASLVSDPRAGFDLESLDAEGRLFQVKLYADGAPAIYTAAPDVDLTTQLRGSIGELLLWASSREVVSLVQHPFWHDVATVLPNSRVVYDCMDHHEGFGNTAGELLGLECALFKDADLTVTTSAWLDQAVANQASRRALIRNAGEFDHFAKRPISVYKDSGDRRIIGYYGAIAEWFDQDLVEAVAKRFPECLLLLVGADTANAKFRLGRQPNVKFIGEVPYAELPHYLYSFDACMLPFKVIPLTLATNPVKVYEYLSAGKTVVSVDLPEMRQFGELVRVADTAEGFLATMADVLSRPAEQAEIDRRQAFAKEQTWTHRAEALIACAEQEVQAPKVSVIVVTYNNLDLTKACLASLAEYTENPDNEIIVVDNASSDGSKEFLADWVNAGPNRQLILNDDNKGFAAGNNQGLAIATRDYLVMLNNDTYVTPGWEQTLARHLRRDKTIGLIGPVTNNIGNEAKISIDYTSMDEMLKASAAYTRRHIGQTMQIRTAAFFCVMMARNVYERVGPLDEVFGRGFFEDDDYCRRIEQLGLRVVCADDVFIHHHLSASFKKLKSADRQALFDNNKAVYEAKWGKWVPHGYRDDRALLEAPAPKALAGQAHLKGCCNVCGWESRFFFSDVSLWRESLVCEHCRATSRYRSIARGIQLAIQEQTGVEADSLASLPRDGRGKRVRVYDTQPPFYYDPCAYPLPDLLKKTGWIDVELSQFKPNKKLGVELAPGISNQNLECLTFDDASLDIVITSDVMEHVRLDERAHKEIHRVLRLGGVYVFTVPHDRSWEQTLTRVQINAPNDASKDVHVLEPEYHGDTNADDDSGGVLSYRTYGRDLDKNLMALGFDVSYSHNDIPEFGIMNTELYYCRKVTY